MREPGFGEINCVRLFDSWKFCRFVASASGEIVRQIAVGSIENIVFDFNECAHATV